MPSVIRMFTAVSALALLGSLTPVAQAQTPAQTTTRTLSRSLELPAHVRVVVENLDGHVQIQQGGTRLAVTANVVAGGDNQADAAALAKTVKLDVSRNNGKMMVHVVYPVDRYDSYRYITGKSEQCGLHVLGFKIGSCSSSSSLTYQGHHVHVYQGHAEGVPLHVDLKLELPAGADVSVVNQVGRIAAHGVDNTLGLTSDSGDISTRDTKGAMRITADSGDIHMAGHDGSAKIRTDSGDIAVERISGNVDLRADSGDIIGKHVHGDTLSMDTDNGDIRLDDAHGKLELNTDSGDIRVEHVAAVPHVRLTSDNGDIQLRGDLSQLQAFRISTDSGDIHLQSDTTPPAVHLDIHADDIDVSWPGTHNMHRDRDSYQADIGAASGTGSISSDNGDVTLRH